MSEPRRKPRPPRRPHPAATPTAVQPQPKPAPQLHIYDATIAALGVDPATVAARMRDLKDGAK